jgi:hypothetical protein
MASVCLVTARRNSTVCLVIALMNSDTIVTPSPGPMDAPGPAPPPGAWAAWPPTAKSHKASMAFCLKKPFLLPSFLEFLQSSMVSPCRAGTRATSAHPVSFEAGGVLRRGGGPESPLSESSESEPDDSDEEAERVGCGVRSCLP